MFQEFVSMDFLVTTSHQELVLQEFRRQEYGLQYRKINGFSHFQRFPREEKMDGLLIWIYLLLRRV